MAFKLTSIKEQFSKVKEKLAQEEKKKEEGFSGPDWLFKPTYAPNKKEAVFKIRFLPVPENTTGKPWVELRYHMFKRAGDGKYQKALDPRSIDPKAENPISDVVKELYASENPLDQKTAGDMRSKSRYFTLVYIKEAPENQQNLVGKVMVFEAGMQIFKKMDSAIKKFNMCFWDPYEGTDFILDMKETGDQTQKWPSYLESDFERKESPIAEDLTEIEKVIGSIEIKKKLIEKDGIKTADQLREMMNGGMKSTNGAGTKFSGKIVDGNTGKAVTSDPFPSVEDKPKTEVKKTEVKETKPLQTVKESVKPAVTKPAEVAKVETQVDEFSIDFDSADFNVDN